MALSPGSRLGSYVVTVLTGQGGMGEAYRARDTKLGRDVALKVLRDLVTEVSILTPRDVVMTVVGVMMLTVVAMSGQEAAQFEREAMYSR